MKLTKRTMGKRGQVGIVLAVIIAIIAIFGFGAIAKLVFFTDKTPFIIAGLLVLFWIFSERRR